MGTLPPPTEYFPGIIFNEAYYKAANFIVTKEYIDNNFLKSVGYAYSRAIFTNFSGLVYAIGGISTSDITATGTITAAFFTGSGANLTNLNASNITDGTLSVSRGGTGLNTIPLGSLLIGNGANTLLQTTNLSWDNTNSILNATNFSGSHSGSGAGLINLNVSNANAGTLPIGRGGTGVTTFISGRLLYGDGVNPLAQSANLTWNNTNNTLNTTNVNSSAYFINGSPFTPYTDTNTRTVLASSAGTNMTWNTGTNKFDVAAPYTDTNTRTVLASSAGTNMTWNTGTNKFDSTYIYTLPIAQGSTGSLGGVKVDGSTITINNTTGVISAVVAGSGADIFLEGGVNNRAYGWINSTSSLGRVGVAGNYSTGSAVEDIVLRSQGKLIFQSGITTPCMVIDTTNNAFFRNNVGIGTSILTVGNVLDVNTKLKVSSTAPSDSLTIAGTSGNVGLGITTATNLLHLHKATANSDLRLQITDGGTGSAAANGLVLGKGTNNRYFLYNYANTDLYFGTNAVERLTITAGGNIGIGVTNPTEALLDVNGSLLLRVYGTTGSGTRGIFFRTGFVSTNQYNCSILTFDHSGGGATDGISMNGFAGLSFCTGANTRQERMRISSGGNVGIGTTVPNDFLHLHKNTANTDVSFTLTDLTTGSAFGNGFRIRKMTTEDVEIVNGHNKDLIFGANNTNFMRIKDYGAVGIQTNGYAIPNNFMWGGSLTIGNIVNNYGGGTTGWNTSTAGLLMECLDSTEIAVHDSGASIHSFMRYTTNGNFTIGRNMGYGVANVSLDGSLQVNGYILSNQRVYSRNGGYDTWLYSDSGGMTLNMGNQSTEGAPTYLRLGAYNSVSYFESNQSRSFVFKIWVGTFSGTAPTWRFDSTFNCFNANNSTSWNQASDQRIKENIVKADLKTCYDNIKNINLYRYKFIDAFDNGFRDKNKLGYIAQEVKKYFPKATYRDKKRLNDNREIPDLLSIDVEQINASLYGAVKQLIKVVEKQNKRIKTLETLLNIEDNDDVENDAGEPFERIYDENEINIDDIEPSEPSNEV